MIDDGFTWRVTGPEQLDNVSKHKEGEGSLTVLVRNVALGSLGVWSDPEQKWRRSGGKSKT